MKLLNKSFIVLSFIVLYQPCYAQYIITKLWDKTLGGNSYEDGKMEAFPNIFFGWGPYLGAPYEGKISTTPLYNGNLLVAGASRSPASGDKTQSNWAGNTSNVWMACIDSATGQILWDKRFGGGVYGSSTWFTDLTRVDNYHYMLTCNTLCQSNSQCDSLGGDFTVNATSGNNVRWRIIRYVLFDSNWNVVWERALNGPNWAARTLWNDNTYTLLFYGNDFNQIPLVDTVCTGSNNGHYRGAIITYDSTGNHIRDRVLGSGYTPNSGSEYVSTMLALNNGFLITGNTANPDPSCNLTDTSMGREDIFIYRIDSTGQIMWQRCYGDTGFEFTNGELLATNDGNYLLTALSSSGQGGEVSQPNLATDTFNYPTLTLWLVKFSPSGNIIWDKRYNACHSIVPYAVTIETEDGGFLVGTTVGGFGDVFISSNFNIDSVPGCDVSEYSRGNYDYWVIKLDSLGNKEWDKRWGGIKNDGLYDLKQLEDGSYIATGVSNSGISGDKTEANRDITENTGDYWVVRFRADKVQGINDISFNHQLAITPNPATTTCTITSTLQHLNTSTLQHSNTSTLTLYDITGRALQQQLFNNKMQLDVSTLARGVYIAEVRDAHGGSVKAKMVKQ